MDLVVGRPPTGVVELKFPRDPRVYNAADTMTVGELLKDFCRLAIAPFERRFAVQVLQGRLLKHLLGRRGKDVDWKVQQGQALWFDDATWRALPKTAQTSMNVDRFQGSVTAGVVFRQAVGELTLVVYEVAPVTGELRFRERRQRRA